MGPSDERSPTRILIVDDDPIDRRAVHRALGTRYSLVETDNLRGAQDLIQAGTPDCVLLDYNIPGVDTLALLEEVRITAPVVMLTGQGDEAVAVAAMKAGASDYLSKSDFSAESLERAIRLAIDKAARHRQQFESRVRLQREYRFEKERRLELEASLQVARDIQQSLLPSASPNYRGFDIAGVCVPTDATGGDFFDYLPMADGSLGLVISDLCGHGTGPALLAAETRAYIRALTRISPDVGCVATTVNKLLWEDLVGERFATLLLARLDRAERTLSYAAAGHCGYLIHDSGEFTTLHSQSCPLGLFENTQLHSSEGVPLRSGDILLLVTDGLYEARNANRAHFGMERCIGLVHAYRQNRAEKIVEALLQAVRNFVHPAPMHDDITIVVARVS